MGAFGGGDATYGQHLLLRRCQGCHAPPDPFHMSGPDWAAGIQKMKKRLHLPATEWDTLAALGFPADSSKVSGSARR